MSFLAPILGPLLRIGLPFAAGALGSIIPGLIGGGSSSNSTSETNPNNSTGLTPQAISYLNALPGTQNAQNNSSNDPFGGMFSILILLALLGGGIGGFGLGRASAPRYADTYQG